MMSLESLITETWNRNRKLVKLLSITIAAAPPTIINLIALPAVYALNKSLRRQANTAVFVSGDVPLLPRGLDKVVTFLLMYAPITAKQILNGNKVDWYNQVSCSTVLTQLANSQYKNFVMIGHGSKTSYVTTDGVITAEEITRLKVPKRGGELRQHTCGDGEGASLREALLMDPTKGYSFSGRVTAPESYARALFEVFRRTPSPESPLLRPWVA